MSRELGKEEKAVFKELNQWVLRAIQLEETRRLKKMELSMARNVTVGKMTVKQVKKEEEDALLAAIIGVAGA
jgi:1-deoxy-D-xylulose 5-phosphate reductoisomerase